MRGGQEEKFAGADAAGGVKKRSGAKKRPAGKLTDKKHTKQKKKKGEEEERVDTVPESQRTGGDKNASAPKARLWKRIRGGKGLGFQGPEKSTQKLRSNPPNLQNTDTPKARGHKLG